MYKYELQQAADKLIRDMFQVKPGETVILTADTMSNEITLNAIASSVVAAGAKPMVITCATPRGVGKAADPDLPIECLTAALLKADVWIELNHQWLLYSTPFEIVEREHKSIRYINLVDLNEDLMIRTIGKVDIPRLAGFMLKVAELTRSARRMRVTNPAGTDVAFDIDPRHVVCCDHGDCSKPGIHMLTGQINVVPRFGSINGAIVFDGCVTPPYGRVVTEPVRLIVKEGRIIGVEGGADAHNYYAWLKAFNDEGMLKMAHIAYGFNPGAKLTGNIVEDERVWGATEWGIGYVSPYDAPPAGQQAVSHSDGICLNSSVWLDGRQILDEGVVCDAELQALYDKE